MKPDKKQLPQLIVLGILVVICIGYVSFKVVLPSKTDKKAAVKLSEEDKKINENVVETFKKLSDMEMPVTTFPNLVVQPNRRDPFKPQLDKILDEVAPRIKTANRVITPPKGLFSSSNIKMPPMDIGNVGLFNPQRSGPTVIRPEVSIQPEPEPQFSLTGVIEGNQNVAIIRGGDNSRYVVKEGQLIEGRYRVREITQDGATLVNGNRTIYLKLGGAKNAS